MDSEARIVACMQAAAQDLELAVPSNDEARNIIGLGLAEAVKTLFPNQSEQLTQQVVTRYRYHFLGGNPTKSELFAGADEVIKTLSKQGYLLAVATGKGRQGLDRVLEETALGAYFLATRCADETLSKPNPEMLNQVMDELGATPDETLMIGDTEYDLQMANNANTASLAVSYGVHSVERLMQHQPLGCIDRITDLVSWLENNSSATTQQMA
ncbi:MAG: HAD-IIIA family hydrolase [Chromatiales bacterium]|nr:HAD-IIIA family hydrolase [Chromatiales bacterium]